jgi:hypothetical protein
MMVAIVLCPQTRGRGTSTLTATPRSVVSASLHAVCEPPLLHWVDADRSRNEFRNPSVHKVDVDLWGTRGLCLSTPYMLRAAFPAGSLAGRLLVRGRGGGEGLRNVACMGQCFLCAPLRPQSGVSESLPLHTEQMIFCFSGSEAMRQVTSQDRGQTATWRCTIKAPRDPPLPSHTTS